MKRHAILALQPGRIKQGRKATLPFPALSFLDSPSRQRPHNREYIVIERR
jgi:hypothetical protein